MAAGDTPSRLVSAAEELILERGLEAVSFRQILAKAEATNASAIQYHFGDRASLIRAILAKHEPAVESRRHALLDLYELNSVDDLRFLAAAAVQPYAAELNNSEGGPGYLQLLSDLLNRPNPVFTPQIATDPNDSIYRWRSLVDPLLPDGVVKLRRRFVAVQFALMELATRARAKKEGEHQLFISNLTDIVHAILAAPISDQTRHQLDLRRKTEKSPQSY